MILGMITATNKVRGHGIPVNPHKKDCRFGQPNGNPHNNGGIPKDFVPLSKILKAKLAKTGEAEAVVDAWLTAAKLPDGLGDRRELLDRTEGKVTDRLEVNLVRVTTIEILLSGAARGQVVEAESVREITEG